MSRSRIRSRWSSCGANGTCPAYSHMSFRTWAIHWMPTRRSCHRSWVGWLTWPTRERAAARLRSCAIRYRRQHRMSLTGSVFLDGMAVVTVAAFVVLVLLWPSLAGRGPRKMAARAGMLLGVNALVLLTAATQLNAQFLFFADWTDLRGAFGGAATSTALNRGIKASQATTRKVGGAAASAASTLPALPPGSVSASGVISFTVKGPVSGIAGTVVVQLPPGYTEPGNALVRYPVLEAFQGYPGDPKSWIDGMNLGGIAAHQAAMKRMRPALVVSPQVEIPAGVDTE